MKIAILKERMEAETRVAAVPETVAKFIAAGHSVTVETGAGVAAAQTDAAYEKAGATIAGDAAAAVAGADLILKVRRPLTADEGHDESAAWPAGVTLACLMDPHRNKTLLLTLASRRINTFALELVPRITRAQAMDVLSSQSNLAGYRAVIEAADAFGRAFPMMMTAAGTVPPARALILGAGVAGLQAIATARRLGAVVSAFDVRRAAGEQVRSLGATFIEVEGAEDMETKGGYAKEASDEYRRKQAEKITETLKKTDIVITTALIPGRPAPRLITAEQIAAMKPGSVVLDMAVEMGGNVEGSKPGETVEIGGVSILGPINLPGHIAVDASALYARNLLAFITPMADKDTKALAPDLTDEIIKASLLVQNGEIIHPDFTACETRASA